MNISRERIGDFIGCVLISLVILSKVGTLYNIAWISIISNMSWVITAVVLIIESQGQVMTTFKLKFMIVVVVSLFVFENISSIRTNYIQPGIYRNIIIMAAVYWVIYVLLTEKPERVSSFFNVYCNVSVVLSICAILKTNASFDEWMNSQVYLFGTLGEKNAVGQILGTAIIVDLFKSKAERSSLFYSIIRIILNIAGLLFVQCRTAIIAVGIVWIVSIVVSKNYRGIKVLGSVIMIIIANVVGLVDVVEKSLFLDKYAGQGVSAFTSGRLDLWSSALKIFEENLFLGNGAYYVDNAYINALVNYGIIFGMLYIALMIYVLFSTISCRINGENAILIKMAALFMWIVTIFESAPPFGPGASVVAFWIVVAYLDVIKQFRLSKISRGDAKIFGGDFGGEAVK